jgi:hypothetical protein
MAGRFDPSFIQIKESSIVVAEADADADDLTGKHGAQVDFAFADADPAAAGDAAGAIMKRVFGIRADGV